MIKTLFVALVATTFSLSVASTVRAEEPAPAVEKTKAEKKGKKEKKDGAGGKEEKAGW